MEGDAHKPLGDAEEIVTESALHGSRWTIGKCGESRRLLTLSLAEKDYDGCMRVETSVSSSGIERTRVVPWRWHPVQKGNHLLLGDFWPIQFEFGAQDPLARVDAIVKAKARRRRNMVEVQVVWVAANAAPRHELHVGKVLEVRLGTLAWWGCFPDDKRKMIWELAGIDT